MSFARAQCISPENVKNAPRRICPIMKWFAICKYDSLAPFCLANSLNNLSDFLSKARLTRFCKLKVSLNQVLQEFKREFVSHFNSNHAFLLSGGKEYQGRQETNNRE